MSPQTMALGARLDEVDYDQTFGIVAELGDDLMRSAPTGTEARRR
ncbi:MAG: hypothetical protein U0W40_04100 [Acidimicrobiia bacterium]